MWSIAAEWVRLSDMVPVSDSRESRSALSPLALAAAVAVRYQTGATLVTTVTSDPHLPRPFELVGLDTNVGHVGHIGS